MKAQRPGRSMRYLLSIDRSLRRVSLRKMSVRVKNAKHRGRSRSAKKDATRETTGARNAPLTNGRPFVRAAAPALIGLVAAATLIAVLRAFQGSDSAIASVPPATASLQATVPPAPALDTTSAATEPASTAPAARVLSPEPPAAITGTVDLPRPPAVEPVPHPDAVPHADAIPRAKPRLLASPVPNAKLTPLANSKPIADPTPRGKSLASAVATNEEGVTISGCLQARDDSFWLKDASGENAPKTRSWKSGFLKKHAEPVQVVDATRTLQLSSYVAQRVTATGTLANRTMQARSLERVAASCH